MSWKKPVFMLGAVLLCTSLLLAANTPPGAITATATQVAPAPVQSADAVAVPAKVTQARVSNAITATRTQQVHKGTAGKANPVTRAVTSATPVTLSRDCAAGEAVIDITILTDNYPTETTWDVVEDVSGTVVASGGGYTEQATEYYEQVCVDPALCYTFTIYDSVGDGICCGYGEGHYSVYYEGALFCEGGAFGTFESCPFIGVDCQDPCEGNEPPHDLCENAEMVVGPYPVTVANDPTCATVDCPGVLDWVAVWYEVDLPYASNNLHITTCATEGDVYTTGIVVYNDCSDCNAYIIRDGGDGFIICDNGLQGYDMVFTGLPGPATVMFPSYFVDDMTTPLPTEITFDVFNPDMGACCVGTDCVGNYGEADCIAMDGTWYQGEDCATFECPAPCEEDTLVINIFTDNYPSETTWDLYQQGGGLIASGGPLGTSGTLYTWQVCLEYAGCYDFTIYDSYGDGICCSYGEGYYELYLNGVLVGTGGDFGTSETTQVGSACVEPTGACCVDLVCVATNEELECDALDGHWYEGEICPDFVCPEPGVGDFCEDPIVVTGPYPVTVNGTNVGMTVDCPGLLDWNAQWFYFELPYADNDVVITMCSLTDLNTAGIIVMDDCACDDYIVSSYVFADPCITQTWELTGPGYYYFPAYAIDSAGNPCDYTVTFDITEHEPCIIDCVENEGEGDCYENYDDLYNGGCNSTGYPFQTLECGDTICGTSGVFLFNGSSYREMDWFQFTLDGPAMVTWTGQGEFTTAMWLLSGTCDGGLVTEEFASAAECTQVTLTHAFDAGTYIAIIAPADWGNYPCGVKYEASFTCDVITGACCYNEGADCVNNEQYECDAMGGEWYIGEDCATFECPVPCTESQIDIAIMTDSWPSETTWQVTDHNTGALLCSGGPYANAATLYNERCCIGYTDCVDFTIYDSYGDGIYAPGGYTIILDGVVIYDCMGSGYPGSSQTVENFGGGCVQPTGACCVDMVCVATNEELECDALDGRWYEDEVCPDFVCPDTCADFKVTAPYTSELMSTCGWGDECSPSSQYNDTEEITFEVEIPHAGLWNFNTCLDTSFDTWIALGTDCCLEDLGYNDDSCGLQSEIVVYLEPGSYFLDMEGYSTCGNFIFDVHEEIPCEVICPEGGMPEAEPCGEDYNGGCNMTDPQFEPIACNDIICGTGWFDGSTRDTDWYEFVATNDDHLTFTVQSEFENLFGLIEQINPGVPGCDNITGYLNPYLTMPDCEEASVEFDVVAGSTYYLFVAPQFTDVITCDMPNIDYYAILTGENCMCGDFDGNGAVDEDDFFFFLDAFGTCVGDDKYEEACDFDGDACITLVDYQMWMQCYRDATGKDFVRPIQQFNVKSHSGSKQAHPVMLP